MLEGPRNEFLYLDIRFLRKPHGFGCRAGNLEEAIRALETNLQVMGRSVLESAKIDWIYKLAGQRGEARKLLEELQESAQKTDTLAIVFAQSYFGLGEMDKCFDWPDKAVDEHGNAIFETCLGPCLDPLHSHPRLPRPAARNEPKSQEGGIGL